MKKGNHPLLKKARRQRKFYNEKKDIKVCSNESWGGGLTFIGVETQELQKSFCSCPNAGDIGIGDRGAGAA